MPNAYEGGIEGWRDAGTFIVRRFGRLWPLHAAILMFFLAVEGALAIATALYGPMTEHAPFADDRTVWAFVLALLLLHCFAWSSGWSASSWSIAAEFHTNLVFAGVSLVARRLRWQISAALVVLGVVIYGTGVDWSFIRCLYEFLIGTFVYRFYLRWPNAIPRRLASLAEGLIIVGTVTFVSLASWELGIWLAPPCFALAVGVFAYERGVFSRLLMTPMGERLGRWSYSIYLVHVPVLVIALAWAEAMKVAFGLNLLAVTMGDAGRPTATISFGGPYLMDGVVILYLLVVVAAASLTYRLIEDPARRYFNALAKGKAE